MKCFHSHIITDSPQGILEICLKPSIKDRQVDFSDIGQWGSMLYVRFNVPNSERKGGEIKEKRRKLGLRSS